MMVVMYRMPTLTNSKLKLCSKISLEDRMSHQECQLKQGNIYSSILLHILAELCKFLCVYSLKDLEVLLKKKDLELTVSEINGQK